MFRTIDITTCGVFVVPFVMICPTCYNPLTVQESQAGQAVGCPTCRNPLTVPEFAPIAEPLPPVVALPSGSEDKRRTKYERTPQLNQTSPLLLVVTVIGSLAAIAVIAMIFFMQNRSDDNIDKQRLEEIHRKHVETTNELLARESQIAERLPRGVNRQIAFHTDPQWQEIHHRVVALEIERGIILRRHPTWRLE